MEKKQVKTCGLHLPRVPVKVHSYFKAYCAKMGTSMSEVLIAYMKKCAKSGMKASKEEQNATVK